MIDFQTSQITYDIKFEDLKKYLCGGLSDIFYS